MSNIRILSLASIKGGVGKSVSSVNIASSFSNFLPNSNIILIDLDPQGNSSNYLGYDSSKVDMGVKELFENPNISIDDVLNNTHKENLYIIPSTLSLMNTQLLLTTKEIKYKNCDNHNIIKMKIEDYIKNSNKDTIIIFDTRPDFDILTTNALMCSDRILCPINPCEFSLNGFSILENTLMSIRERYNPKLRLLGVFKNKWSKTNTNPVKKIELELDDIKNRNILFDTIVPNSISIEETKISHLPIVDYPKLKSNPVGKAYNELVIEISKKWSKVVR